jgi:hypothetical protein
MTKNNFLIVFAFLAPLLLTSAAAAAGKIASVGFECTGDPERHAWFHSYRNDPYPVTLADAKIDAEHGCARLRQGAPVNAEVTFTDGERPLHISPTDKPSNNPATEANNPVTQK